MKCNNRHDDALLHKWVSRLLMTVCIASSTTVAAGDLEKAKRMHDRLTGITAPSAAVDPTDTTLTDMAALISTGDPDDAEAAAAMAMNNPAFYNVTLKNFASPWTNEEQTVFVPLNDYTATVIGMIRDDVDFRQVLSGDIIYTGTVDGSVVTANYSNTDNTHYEQLEQTDLKTSLKAAELQSTVTGLDSTATAGVMTTRAAARSFFEGGTNRAMFRFTFMNHLCTDLEPLKDVTRVPDHVRRDVSRSPGGDSRIFLNHCVGCHAGMDGLAGALAKYEWDGTQLLYNDVANISGLYDANGVSLKHNINGGNFKYGYLTVDDSWVNYWRNGQNSLLGWDPTILNDDGNGHETGNGAKSFGQELAKSDAFASCQVKKVFKAVCLRNSDDYTVDRGLVSTITGDIGAGPIIMKDVFAKVAVHCMDNPVAP